MTSPGVLEPEPLASSSPRPWERRIAGRPVVAGILSGLLLWSSFPPLEWHWLAWFALTPLFGLAVFERPRLRLYLGAWAGGLVFWLLSIQWVRLTDPSAWLAWVTMAVVLSLWWPGFLALIRYAVRGLRLPLIVAAPLIWVGLEFVRAHFLTGFPWYYLGHSQYRFLALIQVADVASALGVSFLIAVVNAWLVDLVSLPLLQNSPAGPRLTQRQTVRLWAVTLLIGGTLIYGAYRLSTARFREGPRLALLQTNFEQRYKMGGDPAALVERIHDLIRRAISAEPLPDLIVWPETSYPYGYIAIDPAVALPELSRQLAQVSPDVRVEDWVRKRDDIDHHLRGLAAAARVPMLVGTTYYDHRPGGLRKYNSAVLFEPLVQSIQAYHKIHLVPFGEYVPFLEAFPWLTVLTPYRNGHIPSLAFGQEAKLIQLGPYQLAVAICFEDSVPHVVRRFFAEAGSGHEPDVLINLSNDGWFHGSSELDMHLAVSVFRTIEQRVPLARAVNTGISALIDGNGEIRETLPKLSESVLLVTVPLDDRTSYYTRWGDWLGISCLAVTIGLVPVGVIRRRLHDRRKES